MMSTPRYFIWRPTDREPWRIYSTKRHYHPTEMERLFGPHGAKVEPPAWQGDDYQTAVRECKRLNQERKGAR